MVIKEYLHKRKMRRNTLENQIETLQGELFKRDTKICKLEKEKEKLKEELLDARASQRIVIRDENKSKKRRKSSKVCNDKRRINAVCNEIQ